MIVINPGLPCWVGEETPGEWVVYYPGVIEQLGNRIGSVSRSWKPLHLPPPGQLSVGHVDSVPYSLV